jgi:hypothetical protein
LKVIARGVSVALSIYVLLYFLNSAMGGYWLVPGRDGRVRFKPEFGGLSMTVAIMWQPRLGHNSLGESDFLGTLSEPLILLDRAWFRKTHYLTDNDFDSWIEHLPVSKVHPRWRDEYVTKVTAEVTRDEAKRELRCKIRLSGSDRPRNLTEIMIDRELAEVLGATPPPTFVEKPFEGSRAYRNKTKILWVGKTALFKGEDVLIVVPVARPKEGAGTIVFSYRYSDDSENSVQTCSVKLGSSK